MRKVTIYTDGACSGNPGPGGYGAILIDVESGKKLEIAGGDANTTNNRMELMGVIEALSLLKMPCDVTLYTDSKYVVDAMKLGWAKKWQKNNWMRNKTDRAKNPELWEKLLSLCDIHHVTFSWVKGHADNPMNNRCDEMAVQKSKEYSTKA
ncbi:MAG: ribonuclease HI [Clostridia bacterium]|nr:ribonuclease HI [Clostridia bacterium]